MLLWCLNAGLNKGCCQLPDLNVGLCKSVMKHPQSSISVKEELHIQKYAYTVCTDAWQEGFPQVTP